MLAHIYKPRPIEMSSRTNTVHTPPVCRTSRILDGGWGQTFV